MFDEHSQRTIEQCLNAAEEAMERASIGVRRTSIEMPHGFTSLLHFDENYRFTRVYRPGHGMAPFRTFIRATPNTSEYDQQTFDLLAQLSELEHFFRPFLADPDIEIPEVSEGYVKNELRFMDTSAWPDDLNYNLTYKAEEMFRNSTGYMPPRFVDLSDIAPLELDQIPPHLRYEHAIKNAIDLVCMGPWAGIPVPKIIRALRGLCDDLSRGEQNIEPPILQCLEPERTRRLTIPLWRAGRFHGVFSVVMGGSLKQLEPLDGLVAECVSVSHLLFSVMQRERERRARMVLRSGLLHQDRPIVEAIRQAAHILAAPHYIRDVAVTGAKNHSNNNSFGKNENDALPLRFTVQETLFDQPVRIEVELFDEERKIIRDLMKIYISNELRRIHSEISAELTAEAGAEDMAEGSAQTRAAVEERASRILKENEHNGNLENRKYALCLLSLAILKQRTAPIVEIFGNMRKSYREELSSEYGIGRRTNSSSKSNSSQDGPHLSQIFEEKKALEYVERQFPGLEIFKSYGRIEARFRNG